HGAPAVRVVLQCPRHAWLFDTLHATSMGRNLCTSPFQDEESAFLTDSTQVVQSGFITNSPLKKVNGSNQNDTSFRLFWKVDKKQDGV
ncbi:MAG: hypothetical protein H9993_06265, partial [Candidatus Desulfovibrio faecigallinarum]|nr:hypothetical protein [Candidatus Desulfovibrio faecigallinarum]